jgi:hypothetical protein
VLDLKTQFHLPRSAKEQAEREIELWTKQLK